MTMPLQDSDAVAAEIARIVDTSPELFDSDTVANARDMLVVCRDLCPVPDDVAKGYWNTFSLVWSNREIEVFDDRLEVYRFIDQRTDIWYEDHRPGQTFSPKFLAELATFVSKTSK